jgi:hypothetical protein
MQPQPLRLAPAPGDRQAAPSAKYPSQLHRADLPPAILGTVLPDDLRFATYLDDARFVLTTPEVRCVTRIDLVYVPGNPAEGYEYFWGTHDAPQNLFANHSLWLTKRADPCIFGGIVNVENLLGDCYHGQQIPQPGCMGYHVEAVTCADEIWGKLHVEAPGTGEPYLPMGDGGNWIVRIAADAIDPMEKAEWDRLRSRLALRIEKAAKIWSPGMPT